MENKKCKHEWRQKLRGGCGTMQEAGYYCIYCLIKVRDEKELNSLGGR